MFTEMSTVWPGATFDGRATEAGAPIRSPLSKISETSLLFQVQVPMFFKRQVFVNVAPGAKFVPSGMVTSAMNCAQ